MQKINNIQKEVEQQRQQISGFFKALYTKEKAKGVTQRQYVAGSANWKQQSFSNLINGRNHPSCARFDSLLVHTGVRCETYYRSIDHGIAFDGREPIVVTLQRAMAEFKQRKSPKISLCEPNCYLALSAVTGIDASDLVRIFSGALRSGLSLDLFLRLCAALGVVVAIMPPASAAGDVKPLVFNMPNDDDSWREVLEGKMRSH